MPPQEFSNRPGRQPYPRRRAGDNVTAPAPRPLYSNRGVPRPDTARPPAPPRPITGPQPPIIEIAPASRPALAPTPVVQAPAPKVLDFTPPTAKKKRRTLSFAKVPKLHKPTMHVSKPIALFVVAGLVVASGVGLVYGKSTHSSDDATLRQALQLGMQTTQLHAQTTGPQATSSVDYDFSKVDDPIVSTVSTVQIGGAAAKIAGYGNVKNSYSSYRQLPIGAPEPDATKVTDSWVQLRTNGTQAVGVPSSLTHVADPRYQAYGPVLLGNPPPALQKQLLDYIFAHQVYDYSGTKPTQTKIGDTKATLYTTVPSVSYLKIVNQSLASGSGLSPTDIQDATASLDALKGAQLKLYIATKSHRIVRTEIVKNNQTTTTDYSQSGKSTISAEPQTHLNWQTFATTQFKLASAIASKQPAMSLDTLRKNQLDAVHSALKTYFQQTASYPSLGDLNDQSWIQANLPGLDSDSVRDPLGATQTMLPGVKLGSFGYQTVPATGVGVCDNTAVNPCVHYKLSAMLSTKQLYIVQDP